MSHSATPGRAAKKKINLTDITEEDLLKCRICDLPLAIEGTWVEECVLQLYSELEAKGLVFKPVSYLAEEWLTPENEPVIGIPFYLAHPVLVKLEKKMMLEAEGATKEWCMQLLRHETGHAIDYAYRLHKRKKWKALFGSPHQEYGDTYRFRPYSKNYVRHLDGFYAQYHPDEDFVETFAVWLTPGVEWEKRYAGWRALRKLKFVDQMMKEIQGKEPLVKTGHKFWHCKTLRITLGNFYKKRRFLRAEDFPGFHDNNLKKIFTLGGEENKGLPFATEILRRYRRDILSTVSIWTGEKKYVINDLLKIIYKRCKELRLVTSEAEPLILLRMATYLTTLIMNYVHTGWYRGDKKSRLK